MNESPEYCNGWNDGYATRDEELYNEAAKFLKRLGQKLKTSASGSIHQSSHETLASILLEESDRLRSTVDR